MKGKRRRRIKKSEQNFNRVLTAMQKGIRLKVKEIEKMLSAENTSDVPGSRTIYRILKKMENKKVVRKEGSHYVYAPHDILRDRWLGYFDQIFKALVAKGYSVEDFVNTQGVIITPRNMGFAPADPASLKRLVNTLVWNPKVPQGGVIILARSPGKIEKYAPVDMLPKDATEH